MEARSAELSRTNKAYSALATNGAPRIALGALKAKCPGGCCHDIHAQGYDHNGVAKHRCRLSAHPSCMVTIYTIFCTNSVWKESEYICYQLLYLRQCPSVTALCKAAAIVKGLPSDCTAACS